MELPTSSRASARRPKRQSVASGLAEVGSPEALAVTETLGRGAGLLALRLSQFAVQFISGIIVTRFLGPAGRGQYAVVLALAMTMFIVAHLSLDVGAGRMLARGQLQLVPASRVLSAAALYLGVSGAGLTIVIGLVGADLVFQNAGTGLIVVAAATLPCLLASYYTGSVLARIGELRALGLSALAGGLAQLVAVVVLAVSDNVTPPLAMGAFLIGSAVAAVLATAGVVRRLGWRAIVPARFDHLSREAVKTSLALHPTTLALFVTGRLDLFVVSALLSSRATGLYSLAVTLGEFLALAAASLSASAVQGQTFAEERAAVAYTLDFCRQLFGIATICAALICAVAYPFVLLVYGKAWLGSVVPLMILAVAAVALTLETPLRNLLARVVRPRTLSVLAVATALVNLSLNLVLIPVIGIIGAALASLVSYWAFLALMVAVIDRHSGMKAWSIFRLDLNDVVPRALRGVRARLAPR